MRVSSPSKCPALHLAPLAGRGRIASAIRVRESFRERGRDCFKHTRHVEPNVIIPESQDAIIAFDKPFVADHVTRIIRMLASVHLNNETPFAADEINRVWTNRLLSDELVPAEAARPKPGPQGLLRVRGGPSQAPGAPCLNLSCTAHAARPLTRIAAQSDLSPHAAHAGRG
jgi:hypothetical protein